jgi:D-inositol-3-phosphate glycosyltransferase
MTNPTGKRNRPRAAVISLHTSPQDQPGVGNSGGMNVYVLEVAKKLAAQGVDVDIFTRCHGENRPQIQALSPTTRLIQVQAGPCAQVAMDSLPDLLPHFLDGVVGFAAADDVSAHRQSPYDVVHSHYWLSGWVGARAKEIWGAPLVTSFHTLGKVKNAARADGDRREPMARLRGEERVVQASDRILAPTPAEATNLVDWYDARQDRIRIVPPGVDRSLFAPASRDEARRRLGFGSSPVVLFVGRLQPFKGPHIAIRAMAEAIARWPDAASGALLVVVGGPSGVGGQEVNRLRRLAHALGIGRRVRFVPPQPHARLSEFYSAADLVVVPSRSESFGMVALEAQACGRPLVASGVGGLRFTVVDGVTGFLVPDHDPAKFAERIVSILADPGMRDRMGEAATAHAARFTWDATAAGVGEVYRELSAGREGAA